MKYWQATVKGLINQYVLEFPNGVKRTYIYRHLPINFRINTVLAGLRKFLKTTFPKRAQKHSPYLELCLSHAFDSCSEEHNSVLTDISLIYDVHSSLMQSIESMSDVSAKDDLKARLEEVYKVHFDYLGHLLRTKHQGDYYKFVLKYLKPRECVIVIDYKMKLEPGKRTREIERDWYGKRGISLYGCYIVAQIGENKKSCDVFDLCSEDTRCLLYPKCIRCLFYVA